MYKKLHTISLITCTIALVTIFTTNHCVPSKTETHSIRKSFTDFVAPLFVTYNCMKIGSGLLNSEGYRSFPATHKFPLRSIRSNLLALCGTWALASLGYKYAGYRAFNRVSLSTAHPEPTLDS